MLVLKKREERRELMRLAPRKENKRQTEASFLYFLSSSFIY
jgi:hypothetical protein